jgi:hypothetical protein
MACAGDVVIMGRRLQDVEEVFITLVEEANKMVLEINGEKTKFIIVSRKPYNEHEYVKRFTYNFEIANDYVYLGIILANKN